MAKHANHGLVNEALGILSEVFADVNHKGPHAIADFRELQPGTDEYDRVCQDAFQRVRFVLDNLR